MRRDDTRRTIVGYDIPNDRRRTRISKVLAKYGDRIQYSVFVVDCSPARLLRLKDEISDEIVKSEDSILFCDLGKIKELKETKYSYLGLSKDITDNDMLIL